MFKKMELVSNVGEQQEWSRRNWSSRLVGCISREGAVHRGMLEPCSDRGATKAGPRAAVPGPAPAHGHWSTKL